MDAFIIILTAILIASANGLLGSYLVLRKSVMIGDAISHAVLPGLVIGFLISGSRTSLPMLLGAALSGLLCAFLIQILSSKSVLPKDASTGFIFTFLFAAGVILVTLFAENVDIDPDCVLHGEIGYITLEEGYSFAGMVIPNTTIQAFILMVIVCLFIVLFRHPLFIGSFDPEYAESIGLKTRTWDLMLMGITALTTVISFNAVGAILVVAFMVIPAASAYLTSNHLKPLFIKTILYTIVGCSAGYYVSIVLNTTISSAIVSVMGVCFLITLIFVLWQRRRIQA